MFCALYSPDYRLAAALRYRPEWHRRPAAVVDAPEGTPVVVERNALAARAEVEPGMSPTQAQARCLELLILSRSAAAERALAETLLGVACGVSAYVEATGPNLCTLDLRGCRAAGEKGLDVWGAALAHRVEALHLRARVGIAENPDLAFLAARCTTAREPVRVVGSSAEFLHGLSLAVLEPPPEMLEVLHGWGIGTLGGLTRLKREAVSARLGPEGGLLWDRAAGRSTRLLRLVRPLETYEEAFDFERELETAQPLLFLLRRFVDGLVARLADGGLAAAAMRLTLPLSGGTFYERLFQIPSPTANADVLYRVLDTHFENLRLEQAPTGVRLGVEPVRPEHRQFRFFESVLSDPNRFAETLARLGAVVGGGNVGIPGVKATHKPDQFELTTPDFTGAVAASADAPLPAVGLPLRRFRPPFPAQVQVAQTSGGIPRPEYVVSEHAHGRVVEALGPYLISGDWWESPWNAEEWDVQVAGGGLYRLSRAGAEWKVEGCYDE
jgi:protein ImuB